MKINVNQNALDFARAARMEKMRMDYKAEYERLKNLAQELDGAINQFLMAINIEHESNTVISLTVPDPDNMVNETRFDFDYDIKHQSNVYIALQDFYYWSLELNTAFLKAETNEDDIPF